MGRLEMIERDNWERFLKSPIALLMLAKTGCPACQKWTEELEARLEDPDCWSQVRFGKIFLDKPGLAAFKKANPWLTEVDVLPTNLIYVNGVKTKAFAGGGLDRLENRLNRIIENFKESR